MVDPVHLAFAESGGHLLIQLFSGRQVGAERLLDDNSVAVRQLAEVGFVQSPDRLVNHRWRNAQIVGSAGGLRPILLRLFDQRLQRPEQLRIVQVPENEVEAFGELAPLLGIGGSPAGECLHPFLHFRSPGGKVPAAAVSDNAELLGKQSFVE